MKRILTVFTALTLVFGLSVFSYGDVTSKVEKLIDSNQSNLDRTYAPRDKRPNQISLQYGTALLTGFSYSYNLNEMLAVGVGVGSIYPGLSADLHLTAYLLPTTIAPYVSAGVVYYGTFTENIEAGELAAGVDFALDNGFGVNLGLGWVRSFADTSGAPFENITQNDSINWISLQLGLNYRL
jgi:hypothetical protein